MFNESKEAGIGIVVQDSSGQVVATMAEKIQKPHSLESLELLVARRAMIFFFIEIGLQQFQFKGNSKTSIKALQTGEMLSSSFGHLVRDTLIHVSSLRSFSFSYC